METTSLLMCRPDYYRVIYKINTHMKRKGQKPVNLAVARIQWEGLGQTLTGENVNCCVMDQVEGFPDMVFTANAGLVYRDDFVLSRFRFQKERGGEEAYFRTWFCSFGYRVHELPQEESFEGAGDALFLFDEEETLVIGYGEINEKTYFRTSERGARLAAECIGKEPVLVKLIHPDFYHLDTCFCPIGKYILCYPRAFDAHSLRVIENHGEVIPVSYHDAMRFVCNGIPLKNPDYWKLITTDPSRALRQALARCHIDLGAVDLSEFHKAGGSARCLVIFL